MRRFLKRLALPRLARAVRSQRLTYLSIDKLHSLHREVDRIVKNEIPGDFLEFGVALGGSAICLAKLARGRRFIGFDVFGMIPAPSGNDENDSHSRYQKIKSGKATGIKGDPYYGYDDRLYEKVIENFGRNGIVVDQTSVRLVKGRFEDTVRFADHDRVALAHIDCDWYDPVTFCLNTVVENLSPSGVIVVDDYNDYAGCKKAVDEFVARNNQIQLKKIEPHAILLKLGGSRTSEA